jgi:hypothetical protein
MKWIKDWLIRYWLAKHLSVPFGRAVNWTVEDKASFDLFGRSMCGIKFFELLRQTVAAKTFRAVYSEGVSASAQARGMQDLLALINHLRSFPSEESVPSLDEDIEPLPSQRTPMDSWRYQGGGGSSAIR